MPPLFVCLPSLSQGNSVIGCNKHPLLAWPNGQQRFYILRDHRSTLVSLSRADEASPWLKWRLDNSSFNQTKVFINMSRGMQYLSLKLPAENNHGHASDVGVSHRTRIVSQPLHPGMVYEFPVSYLRAKSKIVPLCLGVAFLVFHFFLANFLPFPCYMHAPY